MIDTVYIFFLAWPAASCCHTQTHKELVIDAAYVAVVMKAAAKPEATYLHLAV